MKKLCSMLLIVILAVSLAACQGTKNQNAQSQTQAGNQETEKDNEEEKEGENEENDVTSGEETINIGVIQIVDHPALNASYDGFIDALKDAGYEVGKNITVDYRNAQGDQSNLKTISQRFVNNNVDLILAIATPAAQSIATETSEIPILITAVTDPVAAELVESIEKPNTNVSGTSDLTPVANQFDLIKEVFPDAKRIGIMYNSSEINSEIQANLAKDSCDRLGFTYEVGTVTSTNDIDQVAQSLVGKVDVVYVPTDNLLASAMPLLTKVANANKVPTIAGESGMVASGALLTIGIDYYQLGYQTGEMAVQILRDGAKIQDMPIQYAKTSSDISINMATARELEITLPQDIIDKAVNITEE